MKSSSRNSSQEQASKRLIVAAIMERKRREAIKLQLQKRRQSKDKPSVSPAFEFLYQSHTDTGEIARFKVAKGGRGKGASWAIADRLLEKASSQNSLILCTREVQNSIADSVHRLLRNRIKTLGYSEFFDVTSNRIKSRVSDSEFLFRGLNDLTVDSIRSMEGITDVWVAEAEKLGANSWMILEPTIRVTGSTIYVDYNPDTEESPTNVKFTKECPDNAIVRHLTFADNPYFPEVLEKLRQQALARIAQATSEEAREQATLDYNHVWLGHTRKVSKASIFGAYHVVETFEPNDGVDGWDGPYDGADWGFGADPTTRVRCWIRTTGAVGPSQKKFLCVERELYLKSADGAALQLRDLPRAFDEFPNGRTTLIRADNSQPQSIGYMKNQGFQIKGADKWTGSVEDGIQHMRGSYSGIIVHPRCQWTAKEMQLYSYKVDRLTGDVKPDIVDLHNHCIDAIRYALDPLIQRKKGAHLFG